MDPDNAATLWDSAQHAVITGDVSTLVSGDALTLERLLREHPELVHTRLTRQHRSTLLHYVGANGIGAVTTTRSFGCSWPQVRR